MYYLEVYLVTSLNKVDDTIPVELDYSDLSIIERRLEQDYTDIKNIFKWDYNIENFQYLGNYIFYILLSSDNPFDDNSEISPQVLIDIGPDTWMEGNIVIYEKDQAEWELFVDIYEYGMHYKL